MMTLYHIKSAGGRAYNSILYVRAEFYIDTSGRERVRYLEILSHESLECGSAFDIEACVHRCGQGAHDIGLGKYARLFHCF